MLVYFGMGGDPMTGLLWGVCVSVSILVHELGHALVAKHYRLAPSIMLHGWGGLCAHQQAERDRHDFLIIAAGPGAGLILGAIVFAASIPLAPWLADKPLATMVVWNMLYINLFWSLVNLLPLWPLDGGQIFRIILIQFLPPARAERITHVVGTVVGIAGMALGGLFLGPFVVVLAALNTWENVKRINETSASGPIRSRSKASKGLVQDARAAQQKGDHAEAVRLCHRARAEHIDSVTLADVWDILAISTTAMGDHEEAWSYLHRARATPATLEAKARCAIALGKRYEAQQILESDNKLPPALKLELETFTRSS